MVKTVSANDAKNRFGALIGYVSDEDGEVVVENRGKPKAVIISMDAYQEMKALREQRRRSDLLAELRDLRIEVRSQNQDLTSEEADEIADRVSRDVINDRAATGVIAFERDRSERR